MATFVIRRARPEEATAISALIDRTVLVSNIADYDAAAIDALRVYSTPSYIAERMAGRDVFVALDGDRLIGTVSLGDGRLRAMYVDPERQGSGLGRRLVEHLEAHARSLGHLELKLSSSLTARGFYRKVGYREIEYQAAEVPTWLMEKKLL
jgi:putative acetyltransferase